jgi:TatA/E family protein of Tat protein translocase
MQPHASSEPLNADLLCKWSRLFSYGGKARDHVITCGTEKYAAVLGNKLRILLVNNNNEYSCIRNRNLGGPDLFIILLIVLVLFGAKKLPDLARSIGQSMNEFRKAREDFDRDLHNSGTQPSQPQLGPCAQHIAAVPSAVRDSK